MKIKRHFTDGLHGISVEKSAGIMSDLGQRSQRLNGTDFIAGGHNRNQRRLAVDVFLKAFFRHETVFIHRQINDFKAAALQIMAGVEHGRMLNHGCNNALLLVLV